MGSYYSVKLESGLARAPAGSIYAHKSEEKVVGQKPAKVVSMDERQNKQINDFTIIC